MRICNCRGCGAPIVFIRTPDGASMPCNPEILPYWQDKRGKAKIVTPNGEVISANLEGLPGAETGMGYITHFATCPDADKFKRGRKT